jgi:hypothetical protein
MGDLLRVLSHSMNGQMRAVYRFGRDSMLIAIYRACFYQLESH